MKKFLLMLQLFFMIGLLSNSVKGQGVISTPNIYAYNSNTCGNVNLKYRVGSICNLSNGTLVTATLDFGDGSPTLTSIYTINSAPLCDSINSVYIAHTYTTSGVYIPTVTISAPNGNTTTTSTSISIATCGIVEGYAYIDANINCIKDIGETILPNTNISLKANGNVISTTTTNNVGYYNFNYIYNPAFSYTVEALSCSSKISCTGGNIIGVPGVNTLNANFGYQSSLITPMITINSISSLPTPVNCNYTKKIIIDADASGYLGNHNAIYDVDFGDGTIISQTVQNNFGSYCDSLSNVILSHNYNTAGSYTIAVTITVNGVTSNVSNYVVNVAAMSCLQYDGHIYLDANANCIKDPLETTVNHGSIKLLDNGNVVSNGTINSSGFFQFNYPFTVGHTYTVEWYNNSIGLSCSTASSVYTLTSNTANNLNFGLNTSTTVSVIDSVAINNTCGLAINFDPLIIINFPSASSSLNINIDFGDGTNSTQTLNLLSSNAIQNAYTITSPINHVYTTAGTYTVNYSVTDGNTVIGTLSKILSTTICGNYSGNVFYDANGNCIKDPQDYNLASGGIVKVENNGVVIGSDFLDNLGNYNVSFPYQSGTTYIIKFTPFNNSNNCYTVNCPNTFTHASSLQSASGLDFSVINNTNSFDLFAGNITADAQGGFNAGNQYSMFLNYGNLLCAGVGGVISLTLDPNITFVSSTTAGYTISGNTISWPNNFINSSIYYAQQINLVINVPFLKANGQPFNIGDVVCFSLSTTPNTTGDVDLVNNSFTKCLVIGTAYDPNDKEVLPKGTGSEGIVAQNQSLEYIINFQNTGTAPAQNVIVTDVIDNNLDISTLRVLGASHFMKTTKVGNNVTFTFSNIMLPDSNTNKLKSHGYVRFGIKPKQNLPIATKVTNTAQIYFDVNAPIITNTVKTQLGALPEAISKSIMSTQVNVYPNPVTTDLAVSFYNINDFAIIELVNTYGQLIYKTTTKENFATIDMKDLANGVYSLRILQDDDKQIIKIIKQ